MLFLQKHKKFYKFWDCILFKIHINLAFDHAVIEFSALVGFFAEATLKFIVGSDTCITPSPFRNKELAHVRIQLSGILSIKQSFSVRRIADERSALSVNWAVITYSLARV